MNTWAPVFSKLLSSSLMSEPDLVFKVFICMLVLRDADDVVRHDTYGISVYARKKYEETVAALDILSKPDHERPGQKFDGRRVEKRDEDGEEVWFVLNGEHYRKMMGKVWKRERKRIAQAKWREGVKRGYGGGDPDELDDDAPSESLPAKTYTVDMGSNQKRMEKIPPFSDSAFRKQPLYDADHHPVHAVHENDGGAVVKSIEQAIEDEKDNRTEMAEDAKPVDDVGNDQAMTAEDCAKSDKESGVTF